MTNPNDKKVIPFSPTMWSGGEELHAAISAALARHADDIVRAADAGDPPISVLIPDLGDLISEGIYWRNLERAIEAWLTPSFEKAEKKPIGLTGLPRARCYRRIMASPA